MELNEFAERVLFGTSLEEKLRLSPREVTDNNPGKAITLPDLPGRPDGLQMAPRDARASFPGLHQLENDEERGKMLHFLANHELLATELMALVLLRFPDAPKEFRMGVFETLKEEQAHTLMYMRRMQDCGIEFGSLPVNDYFWRMVAPMGEPLDFVTRLSLTFEQANLDFSKHYAGLFRQIGDTSTANVLEKIYADEIEHVGHGLKWFKIWKQKELSNWDAFKKQLTFPLAPAKAKGVAPFNKQGRLDAGLDEDFIQQLEVAEGSRGRTPTVHIFNANAEGFAMAAAQNIPYTPKKAEQHLDQDLEMLPMSWARRDDIVLVREKPTLDHINYLRSAGLQQPEWVERTDDLADRKLGGLRPWAWAPDASDGLKKYDSITSAKQGHPWREELPATYFSKLLGRDLLEKIQAEELSVQCSSFEEVVALAEKIEGPMLMKAPYASAGRGHRKFLPQEGWIDTVKGWVENTIKQNGYLISEPFLNRLLDFSAQYEMAADGTVKLLGLTRVINDAAGRFQGCFVHSKWAAGLDEDLTTWLFRDAKVMQVYKYDIPALLAREISDYVGPIGIDAMVYQNDDGAFALRKIVEINMRHTMGRVALELLKGNQGTAGFFQILRKSKQQREIGLHLRNLNEGIVSPSMSHGSIILNEPLKAKEFYAIWHARKTWKEIEGLMINC